MTHITHHHLFPSLCIKVFFFSWAVFWSGCNDCKSTSDCAAGKTCIDGKCVANPDIEKTVDSDTPSVTATDTPTTTIKTDSPEDSNSATDSIPLSCIDPAADCPSPSPCESYSCISGECVLTPLDGASCTGNEECTLGACEQGECIQIPISGQACTSDENPCTEDICINGICEHQPISGQCEDDLNPCTEDICYNGACGMPLSGTSCGSDENPCVNQTCQTGSCTETPVPNGAPCNDGSWCNGTVDQCEDGQCRPAKGSAPCPPSSPCVEVTCKEPTGKNSEGTCETTLQHNVPCEDNLFCNGEDTCQKGVCTHTNPPCNSTNLGICQIDVCDETDDTCAVVSVPNGEPCREQDGLLCNGTEQCQEGICTAGSPFCSVFDDCSRNICHEGASGESPTCEGVEPDPDRDHQPCGTTVACDGSGSRYCLDGVCAYGETPACPELNQDGNLCSAYSLCVEAENEARCALEKDTPFSPIECNETVHFDTRVTLNEVTQYLGDTCPGSFEGGEVAFTITAYNTTYTATLQVEDQTLLTSSMYLMAVSNPCDAANTCLQSAPNSISGISGTEDAPHSIIIDGENGVRGFGTLTLTCP